MTWYRADDSNANGLEQVRWFAPSGAVADGNYLANPNNHAVAWRLDGSELGDSAPAIFVAYNSWSDPVTFTLPSAGTGKSWFLVGDTCDGAEATGSLSLPGAESMLGGLRVQRSVCARGVALMIAK